MWAGMEGLDWLKFGVMKVRSAALKVNIEINA